eukprot:1553651-Amphidinium_carterae.1
MRVVGKAHREAQWQEPLKMYGRRIAADHTTVHSCFAVSRLGRLLHSLPFRCAVRVRANLQC